MPSSLEQSSGHRRSRQGCPIRGWPAAILILIRLLCLTAVALPLGCTTTRRSPRTIAPTYSIFKDEPALADVKSDAPTIHRDAGMIDIIGGVEAADIGNAIRPTDKPFAG